MGLIEAGPHVVTYEGELVGPACEDFESALNLLRISDIDVPIVDLSNVSYISSRGVGLLVALCFDMRDQGRRFDLMASDRVWNLLGRIGVREVLRESPTGPPAAREMH